MALVTHLRDDALVLLVRLLQQLSLAHGPGHGLLGVAVDAHRDRRHRWSEVIVIGRGDEDDVHFVRVVLENLAPVSVTLCLAPAFLILDAVPASPVHFGKGDTLATFLVGGLRVPAGSTARGDKADLQFLIEPTSPDDSRRAVDVGATGGNHRPKGGRSSNKLTT